MLLTCIMTKREKEQTQHVIEILEARDNCLFLSTIFPTSIAPTTPARTRLEPQTTPEKKSLYPRGQRICSKNMVNEVYIPIPPPMVNNSSQYWLQIEKSAGENSCQVKLSEVVFNLSLIEPLGFYKATLMIRRDPLNFKTLKDECRKAQLNIDF